MIVLAYFGFISTAECSQLFYQAFQIIYGYIQIGAHL
jgi:hypothetical protein